MRAVPWAHICNSKRMHAEGTAGSGKLIKEMMVFFFWEQVLSGWQHLHKSRWTLRSLKGTCNARVCQSQSQAAT